MTTEILFSRSLNAYRSVHKLTYACTKILLQSFEKNKGALERFIGAVCNTRTRWRYHRFPSLKEAGPEFGFSYRNYAIGSPVTCLAEAHVLGLASRERCFAPHPSAYSYTWPNNPNSSRNYKYYFDGYKKRFSDALQVLESEPNLVAIIADIAGFYPSVNLKSATQRLKKRIASSAKSDSFPSIVKFAESFSDFFSQTNSGIPVGPQFGHLLGHIALEEVDDTLSSLNKGRYFRYVDDIIYICAKQDVNKSVKLLKDVLGDQDLRINDGKLDFVTHEAWLKHCPSHLISSPDGKRTFKRLIDDITLFLHFNPRKIGQLREAIRSQGLSVPLARLSAISRSPRYGQFIKNEFNFMRRLYVGRLAGVQYIAELATELKASLLTDYDDLLAHSPDHLSPQIRKWHTQKIKYNLSRMFNLLAPSELPQYTQPLYAYNEFKEYLLVSKSLEKGDVSELLQLPGRVISLFCQVWNESYPDSPPTANVLISPDQVVSESLIQFIIETGFDLDLKSILPGNFEDDSFRLLSLCRYPTERSNIKPDLSYLDEIASIVSSSNLQAIREQTIDSLAADETIELDELLSEDVAS